MDYKFNDGRIIKNIGQINDANEFATFWGISLTEAEQIKAAEVRDLESTVSTCRFMKDLLTLPVYGSMEVAEIGLTAKFAGGIATPTDIQLLAMFRAAKAWLNSSPTLSLTDPMVAQVLDACMAIPLIGLTQADKERILRNEAKVL